MSKIIMDILRPINTAAIMILGVFTVLWGFWVINPWWDVFSRAAVYQYMEFMPELYWGGVAILAGSAMIYGVAKSSYRSLTTGALTGFLHWIVIAVFFFAGDWQNTGGVTYLMVAVYCAFIYLNLRVNRASFDA